MPNQNVTASRRQILLSAVSASALFIVVTSYNTFSAEVRKPIISTFEASKIVDSIAQNIYNVAPKYDIKLPENYLEVVPKEILPDMISIIQRHSTVTDK